jgi:microcystin-dependent protein
VAQPYVGEIRMFAGTFAPVGWMFCDGTPLRITENETLFHLIGTTYGGDGTSTFRLPDLRGRLPIHRRTTVYDVGPAGGVEEVTLSQDKIPAHTHPLLASQSGGTANSPAGAVFAASPSLDLYRETTPSVALAPTTAAPVGGSQPHTNLQPDLCVHFIISLYGIFPSAT